MQLCIHSLYIHLVSGGNPLTSRVTYCVTQFFAHAVAVTSDVVPSGTIPPTTSASALSPTPTAPSETAGELTLVLKAC